MFARLSSALVDGLGAVLLQAVDAHAAVVEAYGHQMWQLGVDVQAHEAGGGVVGALRVGGVL